MELAMVSAAGAEEHQCVSIWLIRFCSVSNSKIRYRHVTRKGNSSGNRPTLSSCQVMYPYPIRGFKENIGEMISNKWGEITTN